MFPFPGISLHSSYLTWFSFSNAVKNTKKTGVKLNKMTTGLCSISYDRPMPCLWPILDASHYTHDKILCQSVLSQPDGDGWWDGWIVYCLLVRAILLILTTNLWYKPWQVWCGVVYKWHGDIDIKVRSKVRDSSVCVIFCDYWLCVCIN